MSLQFLLLNQFYSPDTAPTGQYLHDLAQTLVARGHRVKVFCSRQSYDGARAFPKRETIEQVEVVRLPATGFGRRSFLGKIADYATFYSSLLWALLREPSQPDIIVSLTTPPFIGLLGKLAARRHGCQHAHWVMDLYPDVMFAHGITRKHSPLGWLLQHLTRFQLRRAGAIFALGPFMAHKTGTYIQHGTASLAVTSIPLWSDPELKPWPEDKANPLRFERGWNQQETVLLYSGNMGLGHRFGEFLEAAQRLGNSGPRWVFSGGGKRKAEIKTFAQAHPDTRLDLHGYVPKEQLQAHLCAADVHLASLDSAWDGLMVPSKLQASFAVGRPVLFVGGRQSETAAWIEASGGGWVVAENDVEGLLRAVAQAQDMKERRRCSQAALAFARKHFQKSENCLRMAQILESLKTKSAD